MAKEIHERITQLAVIMKTDEVEKGTGKTLWDGYNLGCSDEVIDEEKNVIMARELEWYKFLTKLRHDIIERLAEYHPTIGTQDFKNILFPFFRSIPYATQQLEAGRGDAWLELTSRETTHPPTMNLNDPELVVFDYRMAPFRTDTPEPGLTERRLARVCDCHCPEDSDANAENQD